jgi:hypothetical protein
MAIGHSSICILHPSRGRAEKSVETILKWMTRCHYDVNFVVSIDEDDPSKDYYYALYSSNWLLDPLNGQRIIETKNRSAVDAINHAAKCAHINNMGDIFIVVSDDTDCPEKWDQLLLNEVAPLTDWILKTQDGIQPWIITMPVMDRTYYERFGYIYHPDYLHMFCDTELSCVADITGRRVTSQLKFPHLHYSTGATEKDAVSIKADATWSQGEKVFIDRAKALFGLRGQDKLYQIRDQGMINWLKKHGA